MSFLTTLDAVLAERDRQDEKWGEQNHPDGTGGPSWEAEAVAAREACQQAADAGALTWRHVLDEEVAEAFAESDEAKLIEELTHVIAVSFQWIEAIERRQSLREPVRETFEAAA